MNSSDFNFQIIHLNSVDSTNSYAHELLRTKNVQNGTIILSNFQEKGKGQFNNGWHSKEDKNLLFSILIKHKFPIEQQFLLSKFIALSLKDYLDSLSVGETKIKWPNDILVGRKKVAGILIENGITGRHITHSIIGVGLNVNQNNFPEFERKATSLSIETQKQYKINTILNDLLNFIQIRYKQCLLNPTLIHREYLSALYGYQTLLRYKDKDGEFSAEALSILHNGHLQLKSKETIRSYDLKEVQFLD